MADASDPTAGGEEAFAYFLTSQIPQIVVRLIELQGVALEARLMSLRSEIGALIDDLLADINRVAVETAALSEGWIVAKIIASHSGNRPITGSMETHIRSEPGPLGLVRVGLISELNKILNPRGYGPFWRAQEYGTGTDQVPSQAGRPLYGTFEPSGDPPDAAQRGLGMGHDLAFIPGGVDPGFGRISVELPGRHFLRDGSALAGKRYVERMKELEERYIARLRDTLEGAQRQLARTGIYRGIIEA